MNRLTRVLAALLLLLVPVPMAGRGCGAVCPQMVPAHTAGASLTTPVRDCCRVRADREPAPVSVRVPAPQAMPAALSESPVREGSLRPALQTPPVTGLLRRPGPPLYTLLATLLI